MFKHLTKSGTQIVSFESADDTRVPVLEGASASLGKADEAQMTTNIDSVI